MHTPLTDKCFLTLTQGMKMGYGGNPYGPAGTGKTESVKALGQAFGRQVLVFNCDEGIDFKSMGRIFIGLVKCGAWGCFDEFNRLLEEQLSAISQQIQVIQWAIKQNEPSLELLNRTIEVNKNAGIFVTMNPAGKGYGGRSKLPDNLKQLFRPVAMSAPDNELIAEVYLFSEGFKHSKQLAQKLIPLFTLSKQLLSPQQHYDWGLRALKAILTVGGQLVQRERTQNKELSFNLEALILIKAIRINTMSKLTFGDSKKFEFLLSDMFPGIKVEDIVYEDLEKAIHETLQELNLESNSKQLSKMLQFHEATNQRMGVVIVGPSGCGKSTIWKVLRKSYEKLGINMSVHVMNPKSMSRHQLLGEMDHDTREFKDGVLTESARRVVKEPSETKCWIICDGDIDPKWIESLNSVLDDNHLLTLPNGERISFGDNVNFIFESDNLKFASPATVSRMGMIFLSEEDVNVSRLIHTWIKQQNKEMQGKLESWMDEIFYKALDWVLKNDDKWIIETTKVGIVQNVLCSLYNIDTKAAFVDGVIRGLGGNLSIAHRSEVTGIVFQLANERPADPTNLLNNYYNPRTSSFEQFLFDYKDQKFTLDDMKNLNKPPIVETISAQRDANMIEGWFRNDKPFILVGPEGCGKSLIISSIIKKVKSTSVATIHCNAQTSSYHIIQKLNQMCVQSSKSQGKVYRPKEGQKLVLYLKDINLPKPDEYDTIELIAFLHQIVCYQGFYDENLEFVYLERIHIIASMTPATVVGRHKLSCRFTANVCIAYIEDPTSEELENIYALYLKNILSHENFGSGAMGNSSKKIARFCVDTYENIKQKFSVDDHRHYLLTPKELTKWIFGIMRYEAAGAEALVEILTYEAFRLFRDRLVNIESRQSLDQLVYNQLRTNLKYGNTIGSIYFLSKVSNVTPIFAGYKTLGRLEKDDLEATIKETIKSYEREFKELNIILVDELLEKFAQLERSLSQNGGHVLLAGRSGTGRRTSCQLI